MQDLLYLVLILAPKPDGKNCDLKMTFWKKTCFQGHVNISLVKLLNMLEALSFVVVT